MANQNFTYQNYNGSTWDELYPKTVAAQVVEDSGKRFVSDAEKAAWGAKLEAAIYTALDVLAKIKTVDGAGSGLDADLLDGKEASAFANATHSHAQSDITGLATDLLSKLSLAGGTMTGLLTLSADPTNPLHAVTKQYADGLMQGLNIKQSCKAATTANITLSNTQTIDGVALVAGDRVLVKDQTTASANGIYVVASGAWARATDADLVSEVKSMFTFVEQGTVNADSGWVMTTDNVTLGTTALAFTQFSGAGQIIAGTGLTKSGNTISLTDVVTAGSGAKVTYNSKGQVTGSSALAATDIPALTPSKITQDASNRFVSDAEKAAWNEKSKVTASATAPTNPVTGDIWLKLTN